MAPDKLLVKTSSEDSSEPKRVRRRRNLCVCEQVACNIPTGLCREVEDTAGEAHWLYGSMYQLPPSGVLRCGINLRERWLKHMGITEDSLEEKRILKPEVRWTHFHENCFKRVSQRPNESAEASRSIQKRRRLKFTMEPIVGFVAADIIQEGKHIGKIVPVPTINAILERQANAFVSRSVLQAQLESPPPSEAHRELNSIPNQLQVSPALQSNLPTFSAMQPSVYVPRYALTGPQSSSYQPNLTTTSLLGSMPPSPFDGLRYAAEAYEQSSYAAEAEDRGAALMYSMRNNPYTTAGSLTQVARPLLATQTQRRQSMSPYVSDLSLNSVAIERSAEVYRRAFVQQLQEQRIQQRIQQQMQLSGSSPLNIQFAALDRERHLEREENSLPMAAFSSSHFPMQQYSAPESTPYPQDLPNKRKRLHE